MSAARALRLAQRQARHASASASRRALATTANPSLASSFSASAEKSTTTTRRSQPGSLIPLSNVEAQWEKMTDDDKGVVQDQLEEIQKKDWKALSLDEKKAAYFVAFGPHGPRAPASKPGDTIKIFVSVGGLLLAAFVTQQIIKSRSPAPPRTMTKEWQEASTERAKEKRINPITGVSSEGYSGKGFVQSK